MGFSKAFLIFKTGLQLKRHQQLVFGVTVALCRFGLIMLRWDDDISSILTLSFVVIDLYFSCDFFRFFLNPSFR